MEKKWPSPIVTPAFPDPVGGQQPSEHPQSEKEAPVLRALSYPTQLKPMTGKPSWG